MLICRSQFAAAVSNVLCVCAGCLMLGRLWALYFGQPILSSHSAEHVVTSLDPFNSGTIVFAAITGVVLWLSSLAGGWVENWSVYNRLPQAIADHRAGAFFGVRRTRWIARVYENNVAAWATCIALGIMLGMVPEIGRFAGFPLDVRHVTLSTGTLALAVASVPAAELSDRALLMAVAGIGVIFVLNLSVSFLLAFATAVRAYEVGRHELLRLAGRAVARIGQRPFDFLLPIAWPREGNAAISSPDATKAVQRADMRTKKFSTRSTKKQQVSASRLASLARGPSCRWACRPSRRRNRSAFCALPVTAARRRACRNAAERTADACCRARECARRWSCPSPHRCRSRRADRCAACQRPIA